MNTAEFLKEIEGIIEGTPGSVKMMDQLANLPGWDSMSIISFIAMADSELQVTLDITALASCKTVNDLAGLLAGKVS